MTGVGGRPEVIVEGSNFTDGGWLEYQFSYKPGDVYRRPPVVGKRRLFHCGKFIEFQLQTELQLENVHFVFQLLLLQVTGSLLALQSHHKGSNAPPSGDQWWMTKGMRLAIV